jgi:hypothetical protein
MANVQLAVAGDDTTQVILSVPGVQGPAGSNLPASGTTNQILFKQSNTDYDTAWSFVTNAMVDSSAAIAGTKISPNFGSQNVVTTGTSTAASFIPTSSSVPTNGVYLPSANNVAISTNGTPRLLIDSSGNVNIDSNTLYVDATNNRVGLGTSSPDRLLHVSAADTAYIRLENQDTTGSVDQYVGLIEFEGQDTGGSGVRAQIGGIYEGVSGATALVFGTSADAGSVTERLRINRNGNVGIGTTSPGALLDLAASNDGATGTTANNTLRFTDTDANTAADQPIGKIEWYSADTSSPGARAVSYIMSSAAGANSGGDIRFGISANAGTVTEAARIDSSGRLGLGTSSPGGLLHVQGVSGTYPTSIINHSAIDVEGEILRVGRTDSTARYHSIYGKQSATNSSNYLQFRVHDGSASSPFTSQATVMTLTGQGRVGIGTTTVDSLLHLYSGSAGGVRLTIQDSGTGTTSSDGYIQGVDSNQQAYFYNRENAALYFGTNNTERARITSSGQLLVGTSSDSGGALLQVNGDRVRIATAKTPASASDTGTTGEICWDANYIYVCTATNTWKRSAISTW